MSWREEFHDISRRKEEVIDCTHWPTTYLQRTYACTADIPTYNLHSYIPYTLHTYIHPYTTHLPLQTYTNLHTTYMPTLQTPLHYTYIPTLTPTNPACMPYH